MQKTNSVRANEIRALRRMKDREIDTSDIPTAMDWSKAVVGKFYRPIKKPLTIRVDAGRSRMAQGTRQGLSDPNQRALAERDGDLQPKAFVRLVSRGAWIPSASRRLPWTTFHAESPGKLLGRRRV